MNEIEFQSWAKIPRLNRDMVVTEKIDGTQAAVGIRHISREDIVAHTTPIVDGTLVCVGNEEVFSEDVYVVYAQSRNRIINPQMDNHGFARWVWDNAPDLVLALGDGLHFGEWWGSGIQRGYGLTKGEKRFSLFNVKRWEKIKEADTYPKELDVVPVIHRGPFSTLAIKMCLESLKVTGSLAAPGFMRPEGVVAYHTAANMMFKATVEHDESPKSVVANA